MPTLKPIKEIKIDNDELNKVIKTYTSPVLGYMFYNATKHFEDRYRDELKKEHGESYPGETKDVRWPFIPVSHSDLITELFVARKVLEAEIKYGIRKEPTRLIRFLDAGCGIGNVLNTAKSIGIHPFNRPGTVHGIELDSQAAAICRVLTRGWKPQKIRPWNCNDNVVYNGDILTFKYYKYYDIVYYYCPIKFKPLQILFEEQLEDKLKLGGLIIANLKKSTSFHKDARFEKIQPTGRGFYNVGHIFRKISDTCRKTTAFNKKWLHDLPKKYQKKATLHIKGLQHL